MIIKFALNDFLNEREFSNLSPPTIQNYRRILKAFEEFCINEEEVVNLKDVSRGTIKVI
jgi:integrase/recombinase XerD